MERKRNAGAVVPHCAEPVLGLAEGETRGLHPGYDNRYFFPFRSIQAANACMNLPKNSRVPGLVRLPLSSNRLAAPPI